MRTSRPFLATLILIAACGSRDSASESSTWVQSGAMTATDSAGIRIVTHSREAFDLAPAFSIVPEPVTYVDGSQKDVNLEWVFDAVILADGRIAALPTISPRVLIFGTDGELQHSYGKLGNGPGDFMSAATMLLVGKDSLYVPDRGNARINWLLADRGFVGEQRMASPGQAFCSDPVGLLPGGYIAFTRSCSSSTERQRSFSAVKVARLDWSDARAIAEIPGPEMILVETRYRGRKRMDGMPARLGPQGVSQTWDSVVAVGTNLNGYRVDRISMNGKLLGIIRVDRQRRAVTQAMRDAAIAAELEQYSGPSAERMVDPNETRRLAREAPFADSLGHFMTFITAPNGTLWVIEPIVPSDTGWSATGFRPDGSIVGRITSTIRSIPLTFGNDRVLVRREDANGVTSLAVHRLVLAPRR